jgi:mono/diheme cytochrome c family protein
MGVLNLSVVLPIIAVMVVLRFLRAGLLAWSFVWWVGLYVTFSYGFADPVPSAAISIYMGIVTVSLLGYVLSSRERSAGFFGPLITLATERRYLPLLVLVLFAVPAGAAFLVYANITRPVEPPFFARTVHPSPPTTITVGGQDIDLGRGDNPLRPLKTSDPDLYQQHVDNGRNTYYQNCFFCHGDGLGADGLFAHGLNPVPTDFTDKGILPNFTEGFFFWRVAKGAAGMPDGGGPWASAMPVWEDFLTEEEMWEVVLFLYEFTGFPPRTIEDHSGGEH